MMATFNTFESKWLLVYLNLMLDRYNVGKTSLKNFFLYHESNWDINILSVKPNREWYKITSAKLSPNHLILQYTDACTFFPSFLWISLFLFTSLIYACPLVSYYSIIYSNKIIFHFHSNSFLCPFLYIFSSRPRPIIQV